jgi:hypothetical protein
MPASTSNVELSPEVIAQKVGAETVLLDMRTETYLGLNAIGSVIWANLESGLTVAEIENLLTTTYPELPQGRIRDDIQNLLKKLAEHKLIRILG